VIHDFIKPSVDVDASEEMLLQMALDLFTGHMLSQVLSIQLKRVKIVTKIVSHSRTTVFQMAEAAVSEALVAKILSRIHGLRYAPT
jgi:hypothetical protein